jgi:hypothetical protein
MFGKDDMRDNVRSSRVEAKRKDHILMERLEVAFGSEATNKLTSLVGKFYLKMTICVACGTETYG